MSEHRVSLSWHRDRDDFKYPTYTRDHAWAFPGGETIPASAAPSSSAAQTVWTRKRRSSRRSRRATC